MMRFKRETWVKIASWALIIVIAPFFAEIALVAELVSVDVAVGMLLLYYSAFTTAVSNRVEELHTLLTAALRTHTDKLRYLNWSACWNTAFSVVVFWVGGSMLMVIVIWTPSVMVATQYT